jgi:hypothetical protein
LGSGRILIIQSVSEDGRQFRPSDWIERISGTLGTFGADNRLHYSNQVQPRMINGEKCLVVDALLQEQNPQAFEYIMAFVRANKLKVREEQE